MKERLEQFINLNRQDFDDKVPAPLIWDEINQKLPSPKKKAKIIQLNRFRLWAAAIAIMVTSTVIFLLVENNRLKKDLTASQQRLQQQETETQADYDRELNQFMQVVAAKQHQLSGIRSEYPSLYKSFTADINDLNEEYKKLKQVLTTVPEKDEVLDAMIQNLKLQVELLNEQLLIIQQLKSSKKHSNEKATPVI
jgi:chromosome segregation ATPase